MAEKSTIARPYAEAVFELAKEQSKLIIDVCGKVFTAEGQNMIKLLAENRRLFLLDEIAAQYDQYTAESSVVS